MGAARICVCKLCVVCSEKEQPLLEQVHLFFVTFANFAVRVARNNQSSNRYRRGATAPRPGTHSIIELGMVKSKSEKGEGPSIRAFCRLPASADFCFSRRPSETIDLVESMPTFEYHRGFCWFPASADLFFSCRPSETIDLVESMLCQPCQISPSILSVSGLGGFVFNCRPFETIDLVESNEICCSLNRDSDRQVFFSDGRCRHVSFS